MSANWPWTDDPEPVLRSKFHTAAELALLFEKLVHQLFLLQDALQICDTDRSDLGPILLQNTRLAIERLAAELIPGSLLQEDLHWFVDQASTNAEREACIAFASLAASAVSQTSEALVEALNRIGELNGLLVRFRDELKKSLERARTEPQGSHWFSHESEGVRIYGILVPAIGYKALVLVGLCKTTIELDHNQIAGFIANWDVTGITSKKLGDRIQEINNLLANAFGLTPGQKAIRSRKNQQNDKLWQLDRDLLKHASKHAVSSTAVASENQRGPQGP